MFDQYGRQNDFSNRKIYACMNNYSTIYILDSIIQGVI